MPRSGMDANDDIRAFIDRSRIEGAAAGPLAGLSFAVKDLFDVAGLPTLGGTPDWNPGRIPAERHAWAVGALLDAGAAMVGKTVTDEVSLGIMGENRHHGPVANPRAPGRVPGGSSSGSAAAVAAGLCDLALGTDTGGSVRVPASFCGLFGIRPTHGRLSTAGMLPQAPSFDTAGFLADTAEVFVRAAAVLLGAAPSPRPPARLLIDMQVFAAADPAVTKALEQAVLDAADVSGRSENVMIRPEGLGALADAQGVLQPAEAHETFADWLDRENPRLSWEVALGRARALMADRAAIPGAQRVRDAHRARMAELLAGDAVLAMPTVPFAAPLQGQRRSAMWEKRARIVGFTCIAGLSGVPQVSLPVGLVEGMPVGLSFLAAPGREDLLLHLVQALGQRACPARAGARV